MPAALVRSWSSRYFRMVPSGTSTALAAIVASPSAASAVDLVDQEHRRRHRAQRVGLVRDRPEQRPLHEEALRVELVFHDLATTGLDRSQVQQLPGVVPFVDGLARVDALVALEPDELAP